MSEEKKATPSEELRRQFMDHSTPLNEAGHWARGRIEQLEAEIERIEDELEHTKADYLNACETIADMHCAAVGEVTGPKRGVVDDIEDLRLERDAILASKQMDFAQLVAQEDEIKLLKAENKRLREALNGGWVSFDVAQPEGLNLVQQYLGDHVLGQQNAQFWAFPTSMWRGTKHPHATHWRYVHGPMDRIEQLSLT